MLNLERPKSIFFSSINYNSQNYLSSNIKSNKKYTSPKRCLTPIEFIKEKNKFYIPTFFDKKETKKFLASKDIALMEMNLDDETVCSETKDENDTAIIYQSVKSEVERHKIRSPRKYKEKNTVQKVKKKQTFSPDMITKRNHKKNKRNKDSVELESNSDNENDSLDLYKFIMDNIDDSDDKFYKKYELAKVKTKKTQSKKH